MSNTNEMLKQAQTEATYLGAGLYATFRTGGIELLGEHGCPLVALSPTAFVELMRFARKHMGDEVFREVDRMAGGGTTKGAKPLLSGDQIQCTEIPTSGENVQQGRPGRS